MQIRPFTELVAHAREAYRKRYADTPEPHVINIDAVLQFGQPREFAWGGVGYRAPPLSYRAGLRLLVAANALRDLRGASLAHPSALSFALRTAAACVCAAVTPRLRRHRLWWSARARPFLASDPVELEGLCRWLHGVPDASPPAPPPERGQVPTIDLIDGLANFAREFPGWLDAEGFPLSWAHYCYGIRHVGRARSREDLREATAVRVAGAESKSFREWAADLRAAAGW